MYIHTYSTSIAGIANGVSSVGMGLIVLEIQATSICRHGYIDA